MDNKEFRRLDGLKTMEAGMEGRLIVSAFNAQAITASKISRGAVSFKSELDAYKIITGHDHFKHDVVLTMLDAASGTSFYADLDAHHVSVTESLVVHFLKPFDDVQGSLEACGEVDGDDLTKARLYNQDGELYAIAGSRLSKKRKQDIKFIDAESLPPNSPKNFEKRFRRDHANKAVVLDPAYNRDCNHFFILHGGTTATLLKEAGDFAMQRRFGGEKKFFLRELKMDFLDAGLIDEGPFYAQGNILPSSASGLFRMNVKAYNADNSRRIAEGSLSYRLER